MILLVKISLQIVYHIKEKIVKKEDLLNTPPTARTFQTKEGAKQRGRSEAISAIDCDCAAAVLQGCATEFDGRFRLFNGYARQNSTGDFDGKRRGRRRCIFKIEGGAVQKMSVFFLGGIS